MRHWKYVTAFAEIFTIWACAWNAIKFGVNPELMHSHVFMPMCSEMPCWMWVELFGIAALFSTVALLIGNRWYRFAASLLCAAVLVKLAWAVKLSGRDSIIIGMIYRDAVMAASTFYRIGWDVLCAHGDQIRRIWHGTRTRLGMRLAVHDGIG